MVSWLTWFLSCANIERNISDWSDKLSSSDNSEIYDIQQGSAWKEMKWPNDSKERHTLNLTFSLFIDWFNPRRNKLAGKQQSLGLLLMNCLNLPPSKRNLVSST
jgi:hypothetical protein